jgi:ArsR family transcriptional regulator
MNKVKTGIDSEKLHLTSELMRAVAHPLRLRMIGFIDKNPEINVNKIYNSLKLEQSITSQHLRVLRENEVVLSERIGKHVHYTINYPLMQRLGKAIRNYNDYLNTVK